MHIPYRTCIATGVKKPKKELMRLVRLPDGAVKVDPTGKMRGRGANLDSSIEAFDIAVKKGAIERALKLDQKLSSTQISNLRSEFERIVAEKQFRAGQKVVTVRVSRDSLLT